MPISQVKTTTTAITVELHRPLTMGQIAKIVGVAPRTVTKWCDTGILPHYKLPMSKDRRVYRSDLVAFMRDKKIKIPRELEDRNEVYTFGLPIAHKIEGASNFFNPFHLLSSVFTCPNVLTVVMGTADGAETVISVFEELRIKYPEIKRVLVLDENSIDNPVPNADVTFKYPYNKVELYAEVITGKEVLTSNAHSTRYVRDTK